ncbi:MAG TPA: class I SAM-dependent methyltransferase, partial [Candidatus Dormibacteraeota bacterium]|nr:class I SAM-dependent methyltransferase [Candidatus Dormibacteraeota bacterium]
MLRLLDGYLPPTVDVERRLLDVGCGTGTMLIHLRRYGCTYGVDMDHEAVGFCRERGLHTVAQATALDLPYEDGAFDLVTFLDVLEHIPDQDSA